MRGEWLELLIQKYLSTAVLFLDTQLSLAPIHVRLSVCKLVGWMVGHTFEFPISGRPSVGDAPGVMYLG